MSKQKKFIYSLLIVGLLGATAAVIIFGRATVSVPDVNLSSNNSNSTPAEKQQPKVYTLPKVFPTETRFDTSVFKSSTYKTLQPVQSVKVEDSEIGRENPFKKY